MKGLLIKKRANSNLNADHIQLHSIFKYNQPKIETPTSIYKIGAQSAKLPSIS